MTDRLNALRLFTRVARKGSLSAAGRELGIPQSSASRTIAELEREIGASLLVRTTRAVTLTDAGAEFLSRVEVILAELDDAEHAARGTGELRGSLRVGLGSSLAVREVIPRLPDFMNQHPALQMHLVLNDQRQDLVAEGVDIALRFGALADSTSTARRIRAWPRVLVASPEYLGRTSALCTPIDLNTHALIIGPTSVSGSWTLKRNGAVTSIRVEGRLKVEGNEAAIAASVAGLGITMTTIGSVRRELENGTLARVLTEWDLGSSDLSAVFVNGKATKRAARAFADYLVTALQDA